MLLTHLYIMLLSSSWQIDAVLLFGSFIFFLYWYTSRAQRYWQKRGVYTPKTVPIIGHFLNVALFRTTLAEWLKDYYDQTDEKYFGLYIFDEPFFVVKDPDLVKKIIVKDFNYFVDRYVGVPKHDNVQSNLMFLQKSPAWRMMRQKMTPAFTSGKLKSMMHLIEDSAQEMINFMLNQEEVCEAKELAAKFSTNVIARCAFGIDSECFKHDKAIFREYGRMFFDNSWRNGFCQTIYFLKPSWVDKLKIDFIAKICIKYFSEVFLDTMNTREDEERYNDLIDIIKDLKKTGLNGLDDAKIAGVAIQFFMAGFETTSSTISFTLYEFCLQKDIQEKARKEVNEIIKKYGGITYNSIQEMTYLEMCLSETLRRYPVLPFLDRKCNEDYKIEGTDLVIEKDTAVFVPMYGLQMDEKYFPEPYKYDPERFRTKFSSDKGLVYLPFGEGPRNCIGERFGRLSTKLCLIHILQNFELEKCDDARTPQAPIEFDPKCFLFAAKHGLTMKFKRLNV